MASCDESAEGETSGSTAVMKSPKEISTSSPLEGSIPLHFMRSPVYAQVSHSLWTLSARSCGGKKLLKRWGRVANSSGVEGEALLKLMQILRECGPGG